MNRKTYEKAPSDLIHISFFYDVIYADGIKQKKGTHFTQDSI